MPKTTKKAAKAVKIRAKATPKKAVATDELDSVYLLKLVIYLIVGSFWVRLERGGNAIPIPLGFMIGILFTAHEKLRIDRKIEYALLLVAAFIAFWLPLGLVIRY